MTNTPPRPNTWREFEHHPIANIWPLMEGKDFDALKEDISKTGKLLHPIVLFENKILDGRNRYNACRDVAVKPDFVELPTGTDPIAYVLSANEQRRHMSQSQRALVAAKLASLKLGDNQHSGGKGVSIETASQQLNVSKASVNRCRKVLSAGVPDLVQMLEQDEVAASVAEEVAQLPKEKQTELVKKGPKAVREFVKSPDQLTPPAKSDHVDKLVDRLLEALEKLEEQNAKAAAANIVHRLQVARYLDKKKAA